MDLQSDEEGAVGGIDWQDIARTLHQECILFKSKGFEINEVEEAVKFGTISTLKHDEMLLDKNERISGIYVVLEGKIQGFMNNGIVDINPMEFFGIEVLRHPFYFSKIKYKSAGVCKIICKYSKNYFKTT